MDYGFRPRYCFLNAIYTDTTENCELYELVLADACFLHQALYRTDLNGLLQLSEEPDLLKDFMEDEVFIKCDPRVRRIPINNLIDETKGIILNLDNTEYDFFSLLVDGAKNGFLVLNDDVQEIARIVGTNFSTFSSIQFSKTTMSVYALMLTERGLENKHLLTMKDGVLKTHTFYFAVPNDYVFKGKGCSFQHKIIINNAEYALWQYDLLSIYNENKFVSGALVNKAVCVRERSKAVLSMINEYMTLCFSTLEADAPKLAWAGGTGSHDSVYGVYFESSMPPLKKKERDILMAHCIQEISPICMNYEHAKDIVLGQNWKPIEKHVALNLLKVDLASGEVIEVLAAAKESKHVQELILFFSDLFLYKIRTMAYVAKKQLVSLIDPIFTGGGESFYTKVREEFFYETRR